MNLAETAGTDLSTLVSSFTGPMGTQFAAAAPTVIGAAAAIAVVLWGCAEARQLLQALC